MTVSALSRLFSPRGVVVVGASDRVGSLGYRTTENLRRRHGDAVIHGVNPRMPDLGGIECSPSVSVLPKDIFDVAFILRSAEGIAEEITACADRGIRYAVVGSSGFSELGDEGRLLQEHLGEVARRAGVRLSGPNTNGIWSVSKGISIGFNVTHGMDLLPGRIGVVGQTGAVLGAFLARLDEEGSGVSYAVSCGNEADLEMADYIDFLADDPDTDHIALIIEQPRSVTRFAQAVRNARAAGKSVAAIKLGSSKIGRVTTELHSSRMTGESDAFGALLWKLDIIEATEIEDLSATVGVIDRCQRALSAGIGGLATSGAGATIIADLAERYGIPTPAFAERTSCRLRELMHFNHAPGNPLDLTGQSFDPGWVENVMSAVLTDDNHNTLVAMLTPLPEDFGVSSRVETLARLGKKSRKPILIYSPAGMSRAQRAVLRDARLPVFSSGSALFKALANVAACTTRATGSPDWLPPHKPVREDVDRVLLHDECETFLRKVGVSFPSEWTFHSLEGVRAALPNLSARYAIKLLDPELLHKASKGAVVLDVAGAARIEAVCAGLFELPRSSGNARILIQEMAPNGGVEMMLGASMDAQLGSVIVIGFGGTGVELDRDIVYGLAPLTQHEVETMLRRLRSFLRLVDSSTGELLEGAQALVKQIMDLSIAMSQPDHHVISVDMNPIVVTVSDVICLDARMAVALATAPAS
jgi:acetate---CoA ligase (ADP-forming)